METWLSLLPQARSSLTPVQNGSETWASISWCRRCTLWTQFPPKMLSAGISVPRFQWQEGGRSHLWAQGGMGTRRVLGALSSWEQSPEWDKGMGFLPVQLHWSPYKQTQVSRYYFSSLVE